MTDTTTFEQGNIINIENELKSSVLYDACKDVIHASKTSSIFADVDPSKLIFTLVSNIDNLRSECKKATSTAPLEADNKLYLIMAGFITELWKIANRQPTTLTLYVHDYDPQNSSITQGINKEDDDLTSSLSSSTASSSICSIVNLLVNLVRYVEIENEPFNPLNISIFRVLNLLMVQTPAFHQAFESHSNITFGICKKLIGYLHKMETNRQRCIHMDKKVSPTDFQMKSSYKYVKDLAHEFIESILLQYVKQWDYEKRSSLYTMLIKALPTDINKYRTSYFTPLRILSR